MVKVEKSKELFEKAKQVIPGGVNSETRGPAFGVEPGVYPMFISHAKGSHFWDVDGNEFIDYQLGYGPLILGHASDIVNKAVEAELKNGGLLTLNRENEQEVAREIIDGVPCAEMVRFQNTGSAAVAGAMRIARAFTGKEKIAKLDLGYHGWLDEQSIDVAGGFESNYSKKTNFPGIPSNVQENILILPCNNIEVTEKIIKRRREEIAGVIVEPIRPPVVPNKDGYLKFLREITEANDILLIFDEVKNGFRVAFGGAQEVLKVTPDLATYSKSLGNGIPIAAVAGKRDIMEPIVPKAGLAGTFNANSVSMAAALATLRALKANDGQIYKHLYELGGAFKKGLKDATEDLGIKAVIGGPEPMFAMAFTQLEEITNYKDWQVVVKEDASQKSRTVFERKLLDGGIFHVPNLASIFFNSSTHTKEDVDKTIQAAYEAMKEVKKIQG
ncbi:MAG: aspartate aminotransferase family protein [Methanobacteriota archaeon]